ncbi:uncharacterized protein LOC130748948 isoform X2 [Lotus japonicus]|uniref:uncharacterized protein LOC130748948 isoform X2 n=1 Tax=Lotus japonicus TaxID=34305 RepID=UPI002583CE38|nr:uncharacterized protein LOC130748948 isoform X2 [Lotus japonicus]
MGRISQINAANRAKQKNMHRTGPVNFARIRAQLRAKKENEDDVSQAEMFIMTRQSRKGKQVDEETQTAIAILQDSIQNSNESETFKSLFGKEKSGRVRCYGRTLTPSMMKKNEEIYAIKKQHKDEVSGMKRQMDGLTLLVRSMLKLQHPDLDEEEISNMMEAALGNENSVASHSSASTYVPPHEKNVENDDFHEGDGDEDREGEGEGEREEEGEGEGEGEED